MSCREGRYNNLIGGYTRRYSIALCMMTPMRIDYVRLLNAYQLTKQDVKTNPCKTTYDAHIASLKELNAFQIKNKIHKSK